MRLEKIIDNVRYTESEKTTGTGYMIGSCVGNHQLRLVYKLRRNGGEKRNPQGKGGEKEK